jgi:hypothetical protein
MLEYELANGFYLIGPDWTVEDIDAANLFTVDPAVEGQYTLETSLTEGQKIKVVKVSNDTITAWYPDGYGTEYTVDAEHAGQKTILFNETWQGDWSAFGGYFYIEANPVGPTEPILDEHLMLFPSVSIGIEVVTTFGLLKSSVQNYDHWYIEVKKLDADGGVTETKRFGEGQEGAIEDGHVCNAYYTDITAKEFGVTFEASIHAFDANGQEYCSAPVTTKLSEYIIGELLKEENSDEMRTLAADLLNYGAAAQVYFEFDDQNLVNQNLSAEAQAAMEQFASTGLAAAELVNSGDGPNIFSSVSIMNRIVLSLSIRGFGDAGEVKVRIKDHETGTEKAVIDATKRGSIWLADYAGFEAEDMRTAFDFVVLADGVESGTPLTWSVEGYAREARLNEDSTEAELALFNALLHYVDSAANTDFGN